MLSTLLETKTIRLFLFEQFTSLAAEQPGIGDGERGAVDFCRRVLLSVVTDPSGNVD